MTDVVSTSEDVIVQVPQPVIPTTAPPVKVGLVEISPISQRGSMWMTGHGAPVTPGGQVGDMYLNMDNGDVYRWDGAAWQFQGTFAPSTLTPAQILAALITVDGTGSQLDADLLDGHDSPYFATQAALTTEKNRNDTQDTNISTNSTNINSNTSSIISLQSATTPANMLTSIKTVDGTGSGLDADLLDGHDTVFFAPQTALDAETTARANADTTLQNNINLKANIASPVFTGDPQAPTPAVSDNDTSIATTAFVKSVTATIVPFPEAPSDGLTYGRKNATWATVIGGAAISDTPPPGPLVAGQLWWKSDTGTFYLYYQDVNSSQWVEAAAPAVPAAAYVQKTARRSNLVINGALNVSQENGNTEGTTAAYYAADQFIVSVNAAPAAFGFGRIAAANSSGSQYRLRLRVTTAKASLAAGDIAGIVTRLEGLNVQDLGWSSTASQKDAVLSFGFNGPAGTYSIGIRNSAGTATHTFAATFTITAGQANTDTVQTIKIPAPGAMVTWAVDNTCGVEIYFTIAAGTTLLTTAGWQSGNFVGVTGMSNGIAAVQSFQVWDLYFGADPDKTGVPPVFEVPDYQTELAKCKRYWQQVILMFSGNTTSGSNYHAPTSWYVSPRTSPSLSGITNGQASFPAAVGTFTLPASGVGMYEFRTANASAPSFFQSTVNVNARM